MTPEWEALKSYVIQRHDYFEAQYKLTNYNADASMLGAFRMVYDVILDIERQSAAKARAPKAKSSAADPLKESLRAKRGGQSA